MLCYVMLCYVMLCYVMLCYVMLCYVVLCCVKLCYWWNPFLGMLANLQKATISFVMSVCLFIHMEQLISNWRDFHEILCFYIFLSICQESIC